MPGAWHSDALDARFVATSGVIWGITLHEGGFEISEVRAKDGGGVELFALSDGANPRTLALASEGPARADFTGLLFERRGDALHGAYRGATFDLPSAPIAAAPALEAADLAFAADSAKRGADAWVDAMAPGGALWRKVGRVEGADAVRADAAKLVAAGALSWQPIASGARGDWGFTVGTYAFKTATETSSGSYCTIWKRVDGAWRVAFDLGS